MDEILRFLDLRGLGKRVGLFCPVVVRKAPSETESVFAFSFVQTKEPRL